MTEDKREAHTGKRWLTDFLFPEDTFTPKRWFLLDDERGWIHNTGANYIHFLGEMEGKQVRQCQEAWQLNPHGGYAFSSC